MKPVSLLILGIFTFTLFASSCGKKNENIVKLADGIYSEEDMVKILVELHLVEAAYRSGLIVNDSNITTRQVQQVVLEKMGTDTLQFDENFTHYSKDSKKFEEIYNLVSADLTLKKLESIEKK